MGIVSEHLVALIAKQVEDRSLVVWYDPGAQYQSVAESLEVDGATIARYAGSFFALRREIDGLLNGQEPPRLVVYVPFDQTEAHHALAELEAAGVVMQPGQQPPARNTRLSIVARNALKGIVGDDNAAEVEKQIEAGKLTLADANALGTKGQDIAKGVVSIVFGTGNPEVVGLAFLGSDRFDSEIDKKSAVEELIELLRQNFGVEVPDKATLSDIRQRLSLHILLTDLITSLGSVPPSLASVQIAETPSAVAACCRLAQAWRLRRDVRESYVATSQSVEKECLIAALSLDPEKLAGVETFLAVERALLRQVEASLLLAADEELLELAKSRLSAFWSEAMPAIQAHWALIAAAAEVLLQAGRVEKALKKAASTVPALVKAYADGKSPWCLLDSHHRHMESRWYNFDPNDDHDGLEKLIAKAEHRYAQVGSELAKHFIGAFEKAKHQVKGVLRQVELFGTQIHPDVQKLKTAYVWVDALRFEMARELAEVLQDDFELTLQPAIASMPTITEIGMASLLPKADESARVVSAGNGKLALEIAGTVIKERKDRVAFLKAHAGVPVFEAKLDDLLPKPSKRVRDGVEGARLILVTSQEIDELCEQDNVPQARRQMDGVLNDLRRGVRVLADLGVRSIVVVADHGHLFGEEIGEDMKIEAPGGDTKDLHRRVWVGVGGNAEPSYLRTSLASLGMESEFDIATPRSFACFKSKGGARAYFHGGLSPQELIIPVLSLTPKAQKMAGPPTGIDWNLIAGAKKLTTRFFSVQITGTGRGLFDLEPPRVRVEIRSKGKSISQPVSASYGFEEATGDVALKTAQNDNKKIEPNTITVMVTLDEAAPPKSVSLVLLDAATGVELRSLDKIEVAVLM